MSGPGNEEAIWTREGEAKRAAVQQMFSEIAPTYDLLNGLMSFSLHRRWRSKAVKTLQLHEGQTALDVCCGTGDFMVPLRRAVGPTGKVFGLDFAFPMLQLAARKGSGNARLSLGDACKLPIASGALDAVSVGWRIRNVPDIDTAHREVVRVLRSGGRFVSLDMARPANRIVRALSEYLFNTVVPALGTLFGKSDAYRYLPESTERFRTREQLKASMEKAGLVDVGHCDLMFGNICIHWGRKP
jgi:demethylmenaquinone methyltransferase / 2-methoxy-6-polyprenyl-1,4-benzoquinol methylase